MPKYSVFVQRTVMEEAYITVDADSKEEAEELVRCRDNEDEYWRAIEVNEGPMEHGEEA